MNSCKSCKQRLIEADCFAPCGEALRAQALRAVDAAVGEINALLPGASPSIYLYGSCALGDFRPGWSDIDILVLTQRPILPHEAQRLVSLRQDMRAREPENAFYRALEGGMLSLPAFLGDAPDCVVYWGTSGQRIAQRYAFDSFCMAELLERGLLLCGADVRAQMSPPSFSALRADVQRHYESIRTHAQTTERNFYAFGWLLDIARGLYTLKTGEVIAKTQAGQWALDGGLCPVPEALKTALTVRREPLKYLSDARIFDYAEALGPHIQRFADVLQAELNKTHRA